MITCAVRTAQGYPCNAHSPMNFANAIILALMPGQAARSLPRTVRYCTTFDHHIKS